MINSNYYCYCWYCYYCHNRYCYIAAAAASITTARCYYDQFELVLILLALLLLPLQILLSCCCCKLSFYLILVCLFQTESMATYIRHNFASNTPSGATHRIGAIKCPQGLLHWTKKKGLDKTKQNKKKKTWKDGEGSANNRKSKIEIHSNSNPPLLSRATTSQPLVKTCVGWLVQKTGVSLVEIYTIPHIVPHPSSLGIETSGELDHIPPIIFIG